MASNTTFVESSLKAVTKQQDNAITPKQQALPKSQAQNVSEVQQTTQSPAQGSLTQQAKEEQAQAIREKVASLNDHMQNLNRKLQFSVDELSGETVVKVIDSETDKLIRQVPAQELLDVKNAINEYRGVILETKA